MHVQPQQPHTHPTSAYLAVKHRPSPVTRVQMLVVSLCSPNLGPWSTCQRIRVCFIPREGFRCTMGTGMFLYKIYMHTHTLTDRLVFLTTHWSPPPPFGLKRFVVQTAGSGSSWLKPTLLSIYQHPQTHLRVIIS